MGLLTSLPNIGTELEKQLHEIGIHTPDDLKKRGTKQTWLDIQAIDDSACIHRLYALEGAIRNIRKKDLPTEVKEDLKTFYHNHSL